MSDNDVKDLFKEATFADEPPSNAVLGDYVELGERKLRRRRWVRTSGALGGVAAVAAGAVLIVPGNDSSPPAIDEAVAAEPRTEPEPEPEPEVVPDEAAETIDHPPLPEESAQFEFPATRQLLLEAAKKQFDPAGEHLPDESTGFHGGGSGGIHEVGTKLSWTNPGEAGEGMIYVAVTGPGFTAEDYALEAFADLAGSGVFEQFTEQPLPGTSETGWVYEGGAGDDLRTGVVVERADGSLVGVGVYGLFGNNSTTGVSDIGIDLEAMSAFVTDPSLEVHEDDLQDEQLWADFIDWLLEQDSDVQKQVIDELKDEREHLDIELLTRVSPDLPSDKMAEWGLVNQE